MNYIEVRLFILPYCIQRWIIIYVNFINHLCKFYFKHASYTAIPTFFFFLVQTAGYTTIIYACVDVLMKFKETKLKGYNRTSELLPYYKTHLNFHNHTPEKYTIQLQSLPNIETFLYVKLSFIKNSVRFLIINY